MVLMCSQVGVAMDWLVGRRGKGRINGGGWRGKLRHVASRRSGWEKNVGQQKLAVVWEMLRNRADGQGGVRCVFDRGRFRRRRGGREKAESRVRQSSVWERGGEWCGQLCACRKYAGSVQLNRLEEISDGNVDCVVEAVALFSSLLRLGWEEELCSGGVVGGDGKTECSRDVDG